MRRCDETTWPDKDQGTVCGDCKVLVNGINTKYNNTCDGYCQSMGVMCTGTAALSNDCLLF